MNISTKSKFLQFAFIYFTSGTYAVISAYQHATIKYIDVPLGKLGKCLSFSFKFIGGGFAYLSITCYDDISWFGQEIMKIFASSIEVGRWNRVTIPTRMCYKVSLRLDEYLS